MAFEGFFEVDGLGDVFVLIALFVVAGFEATAGLETAADFGAAVCCGIGTNVDAMALASKILNLR